MSGPLLALILGLLLLGVAVALLWTTREGSGNPDGSSHTDGDLALSGSGDEASAYGSDAPEADDFGTDAGTGESAELDQLDEPVDDSEYPEYSGYSEWADSDEEPTYKNNAPEQPVDDELEESASQTEEPTPVANRPLGGAGRSIRKRRREWAASRDLEYLREDGQIAYDWPESLTGEFAEYGRQDNQRNPLALRDVVAGFYRGHELHIGDLGESTLLGLRREVASTVNVHFAQGGGVPAGMRRVEALDQPPYFAMTSDVRALDRMVDVRVEDSLSVLGLVVSDVACSRDWVVVRMSRRLDLSVWDDILPHVVTLADAAMVLPPLNASTLLDLSLGDRTRELPGETPAPATAAASSATASAHTAGTPQVEAHSRRAAHVQPVPSDSERLAAAQREAEAAAEREAERERERLLAEESAPAHSQAATPERPDITRPVEPVDFPTRSSSRNLGDTAGLDTDSAAVLGGYGEPDDEDAAATHIPSLGEDPEHSSGHYSGAQSRVFRSEWGSGSTIFNDVDDASEGDFAASFPDDDATQSPAVFSPDVWQAEVIDGPATEELPSNVRSLHEMRGRSSGRHRAASARHARKDEPEIAPRDEDYEMVDGEIVDPSDLD